MKHLPRPCAGCREPTSSYREDCRTCQARRRAIQTHDSPYLMQGAFNMPSVLAYGRSLSTGK